MKILDALLHIVRPDEVDEVSPIYELYEDLREHTAVVLGIFGFGILLSSFISGMLYQFWTKLWSDEPIYIFSSFKYGFTKLFPLTLLFIFIIVGLTFKAYRSLKKTYVKNYKDNYLKSLRETYGGAHFQTKEELEKNFNIYDDITETTEEVFGKDRDGKIYTFAYPGGLNRNKIFFGAPGSGKSAAIIKTDLYQAFLRGDSVICTDSKGALYNETSKIAKSLGYIVRILNLKPTEFKNSDAFNLFKDLKANDPSLDAQADVIANVIIQNTSSDSKESSDYWGKNEFNLIKCAAMHIATADEYVKTGRNNLPELLNFFSTKTPADMASIFRSHYTPDNPIRICYELFARADEKNQGQIINGASIRLSKLSNQYLANVLSHDEMDAILPLKKKCIYYVVISDTDDAYKFISALFFSTMFIRQCDYSDKLTREQKKKQKSVYYCMDEYANTGGIVGLPIKIATVRSRKLGITMILQDKGQLETMYSESESSTILNCCVVKGMLSTNDINTAKYFSDLLGTQTVVVENNKMTESSTDILHAHGEKQNTYGEGNRPLMLPEELMNGKLSRDELIYVISGMPPVKLMKYFSELNGEAIHPLEKKSQELGERMCNRHKPKWRKDIEDAEKAKKEELEKMMAERTASEAADVSTDEATSIPTPGPSSPTVPVPSSSGNEKKRSKYSADVKPADVVSAENNVSDSKKKSESEINNTLPSQPEITEPKPQSAEDENGNTDNIGMYRNDLVDFDTGEIIEAHSEDISEHPGNKDSESAEIVEAVELPLFVPQDVPKGNIETKKPKKKRTNKQSTPPNIDALMALSSTDIL